MQLIQARLHGSPRQVATKYGEKAVADAIDGTGAKHTIWRNPGELRHLTNGSIVQLAIDSKGKCSLVDVPHQAAQTQQMGFSAETSSEASRSAEIADYIQRLGKLYSHCLSTAASMPTAIELDAPQVKDIATTLFIATTKHFNL